MLTQYPLKIYSFHSNSNGFANWNEHSFRTFFAVNVFATLILSTLHPSRISSFQPSSYQIDDWYSIQICVIRFCFASMKSNLKKKIFFIFIIFSFIVCNHYLKWGIRSIATTIFLTHVPFKGWCNIHGKYENKIRSRSGTKHEQLYLKKTVT